jgi:tetratricopeptide (TPR) repeat protein
MTPPPTSVDAYRQIALDSLSGIAHRLIEQLPDEEGTWANLAARYRALEADLGEEGFQALDVHDHFFGLLATMVTAPTIDEAKAVYKRVQPPRLPPFAAALKNAVWAQFRIDHHGVEQGDGLDELAGALYQLVPHLGDGRFYAATKVAGIYLLAIKAFLDADMPAKAVGPTSNFTALSNQLGESSKDPDMLRASLEWGERIMGLQETIPGDVTGCVIVAGNLLNTCTHLADLVPSATESYLRKALEIARRAEGWIETTASSKAEIEAYDAALYTRIYKSAAQIHYRLAELRIESFTRSADEIRRLCERYVALAERQSDSELRFEAHELATEMDMKLRLLRPQWSSSLRPQDADSKRVTGAEFDQKVWRESGKKLAETLNSHHDSARERFVEQVLDEWYAELTSAMQEVLNEVGLNHRACRLLVALGALGSERLARHRSSMILQWVTDRSDPMEAVGQSRRQNMFPSAAIVTRVFKALFTLEAFLTSAAPSMNNASILIRHRVQAHNSRLLRQILGNGQYAAIESIPNDQATDTAQSLLAWLPARLSAFGLQAYLDSPQPLPDDISAPPAGVFQVRHAKEERSAPIKDGEPHELGLKKMVVLPDLVPSDAATAPPSDAPATVAALDAYLKAHPGAALQDLAGTTIEIDGKVGVLGEVIGKGRHKVAYKVLDLATGEDLVDQRTGFILIARIGRSGGAEGHESSPKEVSSSTESPARDQTEPSPPSASLPDVLSFMRLFPSGVLESTLSFLLGHPSNWIAVMDNLVSAGFVRREAIPGLNNLFLRFLPKFESAARGLPVPPAAVFETKLLNVYRHYSRALTDMMANGRIAIASTLVITERDNIARVIEIAIEHGERHMIVQLNELLKIAGKQIGDSGTDEIVRRVDDWLAASSSNRTLDQAQAVIIQDRAWQSFRAGDVDEAIAMLHDLADTIRRTGVEDAVDSHFTLGVTLLYLGRLYAEAGRPREALRPYSGAISAFEHHKDALSRFNSVQAELELAKLYRQQGNYDEALRLSRHAIEVSREFQDGDRQLSALLNTADTLLTSHDYAEARRIIDDATPLVTDKHSTKYLSYLHAKAISWMETGDAGQALSFLEEAVAIQNALDDRDGQMMIMNALGLVQARMGRLEEAELSYRKSRTLAVVCKDARVAEATALNLARLGKQRAAATDIPLERQRLYRQALDHALEALASSRSRRDQNVMVDAGGEVALLYHALGEIQEARTVVLERLAIREEQGQSDLYRDHVFLADLARAAGLDDEADGWEQKAGPLMTESAMRKMRAGSGFEELMPALNVLAGASLQARLSGTRIEDNTRDILDLLAKYGPPFSTFARLVLDIAAGKPLKPCPEWLPKELAEILGAMHHEIRTREAAAPAN